jgi:two-component system sensor histidine kinase BaeS
MTSSLSYRARVAIAFATVGIVTAATAALLVNVEFGRRFDAYVGERQADRRGSVMAALATTYARAGSWDGADLASAGSLVAMEGGTLQVSDPSGRTIWSASEATTGIDAAEHRAMIGAATLGPAERFPIVIDGDTVGYGTVRFPAAGGVAYDETFRSSVNRLLVVGGIGAILVALALGMTLARRTVRPVRELTEAAVRYGRGDRAARVEVSGDDEFADMARAFNAMADDVDEEDRQRRAFADDVAHELRTPLAIMTSQLEAMRDEAIAVDEANLASLQDEVLRTSRLLQDLESMAAARASRFTIRPARLDLGAEVEALVEAERPRASDHGIQLVTDVHDVTLTADAVRVRQAIGNLLSNAFKFTPPGGSVTVRVRREGSMATVRVSDTGIGVPAEDLEAIFERSFRGRTAPVREAPGQGIGLAVVREIVRAHAGDASVESIEGRGTAVTLTFPAAREAATAIL